MTKALALQVDDSCARELPASYLQERWYAAYICANHEKRVAAQLQARSVEHFLPLYRSVRRWSDRRVQLELPLFPGYVFVRLTLRDRLQILQIPGVARLVGFNGTPTPLPEQEIEALITSMARGLRAEPHPYLTVGCGVRIINGPLAGFEGLLVRKKGELRLVLSVGMIQRSIMVDVDAADIEHISSHRRPPGTQHIRNG